MLARAVAVWLCIVPMAIVNGIVRDVLLVPYLGNPAARAVSCVTLAAAILLVASMSIVWINPPGRGAAWRVGLVWLGLTLAFEFLVGHYVFGADWTTLRADYNVLDGRLWVLVLAAALVAPPLVFHQISPAGLLTGAAALLGLVALSSPTIGASGQADEDVLLARATAIFERAVDHRAAAIPVSVLLQAHGIAVFPDAVKEGRHHAAPGIMSARGARPTDWTPPAVIALEAEIPLDLESPTVDFILIAATQRGLDYLVQERFRNPAGRPMMAGTLGADARTRINTDLVAYVQFGDYLAGVTVDNWTIRSLPAANATLYGTPRSTESIVRRDGFFHLPPAARAWRNALAAYFRELS